MSNANTAGPLSVVATESERQYHVVSDHRNLKGAWDDIYVEFSGFFGSYGPQMFASAPEMVDVINGLLGDIGRASSLPSAVKARAVLAKIAEGTS